MSPVFLSPRQPGDSWESLHQNLTNKLPLYFARTATEPECTALAGDRKSSQVLEGWESRGQCAQLEGTTTKFPYIVDDLPAPKCLSTSVHTGKPGPVFRTMKWFPYKYGFGGMLFPFLLCLSQKTHLERQVVMEGTQTPQLPRNEKPLPDQLSAL